MEIKIYATLRDVVGASSIQLNHQPDMTVGQMLQAIYSQYPNLRAKLTLGAENLHSAVHILINGRDMRYLNGLETVVAPHDTVRIFPPVGGGTG